MKKLSITLLVGGLLVAFGPLLVALLSFPLSSLFGCTNGGANPGVCAIGGKTMGELLWMMAMMHWITLLTLLPGLGMSLVGIVLLVVVKVKRPG